MVQENGIKLLGEKLRRQLTFEAVEPEVKVLAIRPSQDYSRKTTNESVVADVELIHKRQPSAAFWDDTAESVGVDVEESEVGKEPHFDNEMSCNVCMVEIYAGHHVQARVVECRSAEHPFVGTNILPYPVSGEVKRVGKNSSLLRLESDVSPLEPVIFKFEIGVDLNLVVVWEVAILRERSELAMGYVSGFGIG